MPLYRILGQSHTDTDTDTDTDSDSDGNAQTMNLAVLDGNVILGTQVSADASNNHPGAYQVSRTTTGPAQVHHATVPQGVLPGSEFTVHAGPRCVRIRCPPTSRPGQRIQFTLPPEPETRYLQLRMAPLTAVENPGGGAVEMTPEVRKFNEQGQATARTFLVSIPPNIFPGMRFTVNVSGQRFALTCPPSAGPNTKVRIIPPTTIDEPEPAPKTMVFEVAVPPEAIPGQQFALVANGQRVLVTCPRNVSAGQKIRFQLPVSQVIGNIQLDYEFEKGGWSRTIRESDFKFQWVRLEQNKDASAHESLGTENFDMTRYAYVRKITFLEGNDARMRTGSVELVPTKDAVVDSSLIIQDRTYFSYADIAAAQGKPFDAKIEWLQEICNQLTAPWEDGHIKIVVRRNSLLLDSVDAVMSLGRDDLRKRWRIVFLDNPGAELGGLMREWFMLITEQLFDPEFGLFLSSVNNPMCVDINPASAMSCPENHLVYFRFLGRILGRALFDQQLVKGRMVRTLYKHLLGWPITFEDVQSQDEDYFKSLKKLTQLRPEDLPNMLLNFTVTEQNVGVDTEIELVEGGAGKELTAENLPEYLEAVLKYRTMNRVKPQLTELLLGFFDIIPEQALTVFDVTELETILYGLPTCNEEV